MRIESDLIAVSHRSSERTCRDVKPPGTPVADKWPCFVTRQYTPDAQPMRHGLALCRKHHFIHGLAVCRVGIKIGHAFGDQDQIQHPSLLIIDIGQKTAILILLFKALFKPDAFPGGQLRIDGQCLLSKRIGPVAYMIDLRSIDPYIADKTPIL